MNMDMDVECQYETFNGLPVYYGCDLCNLKELEEYDTLDLTNTHSRPDGGRGSGVDTVDMVYLCRTVSWATPRA